MPRRHEAAQPCDRFPSPRLPIALLVTVALATAVTVFASGCAGTPEPRKTAMKGWELYSWQEDGHWYFSLLEGTNRTKTVSEIHADDARLEGMDDLKPALQSIAAGQWVTWWTPSWAEGTVTFPPTEMVEQVQRICDEQGLELQVVTQGP